MVVFVFRLFELIQENFNNLNQMGMSMSIIKVEDLIFLFKYRNQYYHHYTNTLLSRLQYGESVEVINEGTFQPEEGKRFSHFLIEKVEKSERFHV